MSKDLLKHLSISLTHMTYDSLTIFRGRTTDYNWNMYS